MKSILSHEAWRPVFQHFLGEEAGDDALFMLTTDVFAALEREADRRVANVCARKEAIPGAVPGTVIMSEEVMYPEVGDVRVNVIPGLVSASPFFSRLKDRDDLEWTYTNLFLRLLRSRRAPLLWGDLPQPERDVFEDAFWEVLFDFPMGKSYLHPECMPGDRNPLPSEVMFLVLLFHAMEDDKEDAAFCGDARHVISCV